MTETLLLNVDVRGVAYRPPEAQTEASKLNQSDPLVLVPEPTNEHDNFAVKVCTEGKLTHIGYLPKGLNVVVHRLLVAGFDVRAHVRTSRPRGLECSVVLVSDD